MLALPAMASDFASPVPPPELGETLINYRTRAQQLDKQQKLYTNSAQNKRGQKNANTSLREITTHKTYTPNQHLLVYSRGETVLCITDRTSGKSVPIKSYRLSSSKAFEISNEEKTSLVIKPTGQNNTATLVVVTEGLTPKKLVFKLGFSTNRYEVRNVATIKL